MNKQFTIKSNYDELRYAIPIFSNRPLVLSRGDDYIATNNQHSIALRDEGGFSSARRGNFCKGYHHMPM